ncbi:hypothetical protein O4444_05220 [Xylella fastidiosa subsp. pauca]|nr:hypothetical protein [Xylella fastidiosa]WGZ32994.1 hypothetical protein O4444_05220 [Xylella fastidiosa subsp. pauca]
MLVIWGRPNSRVTSGHLEMEWASRPRQGFDQGGRLALDGMPSVLAHD